ncbi:MAG: copper amine oxidase N-terminal domain-containing protein [Oscillospiraceae bacterium]|jgi:hypothetical protein|nr:copper amine oxidase N-terminal domain-containing protein [Oscillospiraceae bacterium]
MSKFLKKVLILALVLSMLSAVSLTALAAPAQTDTAEIQLNGKLIDYPSGVKPYFDGKAGKVYVPFRDLFEALGAVVSYDFPTRTVSAVRDDLTVEFVQTGTEITVKRGETSEKFTLDVPPVTIGGSVLVPVRFVSQTIGATVGWDQSAKTVIIVDPYTLLAADKSTYTILDKLLKWEAATGNTETSATVDFDLSIDDGDAEVNLPVDATIDVISSGTTIDATVKAKADIGAILGTAIPGVSASADIDAEILLNSESGLFGLHSEFLNALIGSPAGAWLTLDLNSLLEELDLGDALDSSAAEIAELGDVKAIIDYTITEIIASVPFSSVDDFEALEIVLDVIRGMYSDAAFVKTGNSYVSTYTVEKSGDSVTVVTTIKTNAAGDATSFAVALALDVEGVAANLHVDTDGANLKLNLAISAEGYVLSLKVDVATKPTTKTPRDKLPAGAPSYDLGELLG